MKRIKDRGKGKQNKKIIPQLHEWWLCEGHRLFLYFVLSHLRRLISWIRLAITPFSLIRLYWFSHQILRCGIFVFIAAWSVNIQSGKANGSLWGIDKSSFNHIKVRISPGHWYPIVRIRLSSEGSHSKHMVHRTQTRTDGRLLTKKNPHSSRDRLTNYATRLNIINCFNCYQFHL